MRLDTSHWMGITIIALNFAAFVAMGNIISLLVAGWCWFCWIKRDLIDEAFIRREF